MYNNDNNIQFLLNIFKRRNGQKLRRLLFMKRKIIATICILVILCSVSSISVFANVDVRQTYCAYSYTSGGYDYFTIQVKNYGSDPTGYFPFYWYVNDSVYCSGGSFSTILSGQTKTVTVFHYTQGQAWKIEMYNDQYGVTPIDTTP